MCTCLFSEIFISKYFCFKKIKWLSYVKQSQEGKITFDKAIDELSKKKKRKKKDGLNLFYKFIYEIKTVLWTIQYTFSQSRGLIFLMRLAIISCILLQIVVTHKGLLSLSSFYLKTTFKCE